MDNLEEIDKFLEKYNFPKLNHEEIEILTDSSRNKGRKIKSINLEMKMERSQQTTQKYKGS